MSTLLLTQKSSEWKRLLTWNCNIVAYRNGGRERSCNEKEFTYPKYMKNAGKKTSIT